MRRDFKRIIIKKLCIGLSLTFFYCQIAAAQVAVTNTGEGVGNNLDKQRRSPTVSVSTVSQNGNVKILVDAYVADPDYKDHPLQFDFYINRHFLTSQVRSVDLPGPIGIDVNKEIATPPFNYTVIAKVLHPNRVFTTVINGAAFSSNLSGSYDCTLTTNANSEENSIEYISNDVTTQQTSNQAFTISFETESTPEGHSIELEGSLSSSGETLSGTLTLTEDKATPKSATLSGSLVKSEDDKVTSFELNSSDNSITLSCS